jgi:hypothetical protein
MSDHEIRDGGGGHKASFPASDRWAGRSIHKNADELIAHAEYCERRTDDPDRAYCLWRARACRMAASHIYEAVGMPHKAAEALRGSHG